MNELYDEIKKSVPLKQLSALLDKDVKNCNELYLHTGKYIQKLDLYLTEKVQIFCDLNLHQESKLRILDIGTGVGLFPWICKIKKHTCESTYYDFFEFYKDSWGLLEIIPPSFLEIKKSQPWEIEYSRKYDIIVAMRTVFDRQPTDWKVFDWLNFLKEARKHLNTNGQIFVKTNRSTEDSSLCPATLRLLEPFMLKHYNSQTFLLSVDEINSLMDADR